MKKTMKKLTAVLLTALMLMSVMGMQSFAAFDYFKAPVPVSAEFTTDKALSMSELDRLFADEKEWYEENTGWYEEDFDFNEYELDLGYSGIPYAVEVTFEDGTTALLDLDDWSTEPKGVYFIEYGAYVSYADFLEAKATDADTIDVNIEIEVYNGLNYERESYVFTAEKALVDCYVKSIVPLSGFPFMACAECDYIDLSDASVLVTYADGTVKTHTVSMMLEDGYCEYSIDGYDLYVYVDEEEGGYIEYLDAQTKWNVLVSDVEPFEAIEITECDFDAKKGQLNSVSYTIEWKNGKTESFTNTFEDFIPYDDYTIIEAVDGFYVYVYISNYEISDEGEVDASKYNIELSIGYNPELTSVYTVDNPNKGVFDFFQAVMLWIEKIRDFFRNLILGFGF